MSDMFIYDKTEALTGPARWLYAPIGTTRPTKIESVISLFADEDGFYQPVSPWLDVGLAADAPSYSPGFTVAGIEYEQPRGNLFEKVDQINREFTINFAEIRAGLIQIVENAPDPTVSAAAAGISEQEILDVGSFDQATHYRFAVIMQRPIEAAKVIEGTSLVERGAIVAKLIYDGAMTGDSSDWKMGKKDAVSATPKFKEFPEAGLASDVAYGRWIFEKAGTIADGA